jgi:predicted Zn-dependent peptidase
MMFKFIKVFIFDYLREKIMIEKLFDARSITTENGIHVVTIKRDTRIAAVQCGIKIGALYEGLEDKGISHFIEHMLFKGTKNRSNEKLNSDLEQLGGEYNAYTDYTSTVYSITALEEELENAVEILSDMLINSTFPGAEIEKERGVILAEIRTSKDDLEDYSFRKVNEAAFINSPLKFDIIGEEKTVKRFKKKQLEQFYNRFYVPNNCYITIVSSMEHDQALKLLESCFSIWEARQFALPEIPVERNVSLINTTCKKEIEQCAITYLYTFHDLKKESELALKILNHKLGESANSILFRELREERGLAYDVYTHMDMTSSVKTLYIYTAVAVDKAEEAMGVINDCINKIKSEEIIFNDDTVLLMKKILKTAVVSTMEDSTDLGNYVLHQCIDGENIYEFVKDMKNMDRIKKEEIYEAARLVLNNPTIHILMPEND